MNLLNIKNIKDIISTIEQEQFDEMCLFITACNQDLDTYRVEEILLGIAKVCNLEFQGEYLEHNTKPFEFNKEYSCMRCNHLNECPTAELVKEKTGNKLNEMLFYCFEEKK